MVSRIITDGAQVEPFQQKGWLKFESNQGIVITTLPTVRSASQ